MTETRTIATIAADLGLADDHLEPRARNVSKISLDALQTPNRGRGAVVLVTAINPTPAGEGKTTTSIGLTDGLRAIGARAVAALREPSLGPVFGMKGGGAGGGKATLHPSTSINLHFTGDIHAISSAHNLLAALADNHLHRGGKLDPNAVWWPRVLDMNDRALRQVVTGLGGAEQGPARETSFAITAASEVMAILALAADVPDLRARLARIVVGLDRSGEPVTAADLDAAGAMTALLADAIRPNLVQTAGGTPAIVHCGPFANIAHGCSSLLATRIARHHADVVVTEAGFGFDLGGEKFLDLKCRIGGFWPHVMVLVATLRALKSHGGATAQQWAAPNEAALTAGLDHLAHHLDVAAQIGLPVVVALNRRREDTDDELALVQRWCAARGIEAVTADPFGSGGPGCVDLARAVLPHTEGEPPAPNYAYELASKPLDKLRAIAKRHYGARDVQLGPAAKRSLLLARRVGLDRLPVCMAKTQYSISDNPALVGSPSGHDIFVRDVAVRAGAGFLVALTGDLTTMPGLGANPAAADIDVDASGAIIGVD